MHVQNTLQTFRMQNLEALPARMTSALYSRFFRTADIRLLEICCEYAAFRLRFACSHARISQLGKGTAEEVQLGRAG